MSKLLDKLQKNSKIKYTSTLAEADVFSEGDFVPTRVPMINVALSGNLDKGISRGIHILAGPSRHFKTSFGLLLVSSYLAHHKDAALLFYDSEFGSPQDYFESYGVDPNRVMYTPVGSVEELRNDLNNQLEGLTKKDKVIIMIDSIGNLASKKELDDALSGKSVADMTRAKAIKSLFRTITYDLNMKEIPLIGINHTYLSQDFMPKNVVSGGTAVMYNANHVWIIGRRQNKTGTEVTGYDFIVNVEKSRFVKEKSKIPITVSWGGGIDTYSGLLECAMELGVVESPSNGWYQRVGEMVKHRKKDLDEFFWQPILDDPDFQKLIREKYEV